MLKIHPDTAAKILNGVQSARNASAAFACAGLTFSLWWYTFPQILVMRPMPLLPSLQMRLTGVMMGAAAAVCTYFGADQAKHTLQPSKENPWHRSLHPNDVKEKVTI